jgi:hypothetical protein
MSAAVSKPFMGTINVDIRDSVPDWGPFEPPKTHRTRSRIELALSAWEVTAGARRSPAGTLTCCRAATSP